MHSRVFQLEDNLEVTKDYPLCESDLIGDWDTLERFVGCVADYVYSDTRKEEDIEWLINVLEPYKDFFVVDKNEEGLYESITFLKGFKEKYFEEKFNNFKALASKITLKEFCDSIEVYKLKKTIDSKYGFYVWNGDAWCTFDTFVRYLDSEDKYYFGNTIGYHC